MTRYRVTLILLGVITAAAALFALQSLLVVGTPQAIVPSAVSLLVVAGLLAAHLWRWRWSVEATVVAITALAIVTTEPANLRSEYAISVFVPAVMAAALLSPAWSLIIFAIVMAGKALFVALLTGQFSAEMLGPTYTPINLVLASVVAVGIMVASLVAQRAQREAEENARQAAAALAQLEQQSHEVARANALAQQQLQEQRSLLDLVTTLETPVTLLADGVLFAPVFGHMDERRAQLLTTRLLDQAHQQRARLIILDISGVPVMDTAVAGAVSNTARALRLLGCDVTISGISAPVAQTLTQQEIALDGVNTVRSPQEALANFSA